MIGLLRAAPGLVHRSFQWVTPDGETTVALQLFEDTDVRGLVTHALRAHSLYYSSDQVEEITAGVCGDVPHAVVRFCSHFHREDVRLPDTGPTYHQVGTAALLAPWYDPALYSFRHYWHLKHVPVWSVHNASPWPSPNHGSLRLHLPSLARPKAHGGGQPDQRKNNRYLVAHCYRNR